MQKFSDAGGNVRLEPIVLKNSAIDWAPTP
jgi:hypothetical protein